MLFYCLIKSIGYMVLVGISHLYLQYWLLNLSTVGLCFGKMYFLIDNLYIWTEKWNLIFKSLNG